MGSKSQRRCPVQREGSPGEESRDPCLPKVIQKIGELHLWTFFASKGIFKAPQHFSAELSDRKVFWERWSEGEMARRTGICLSTPNIIWLGLARLVKGTNHSLTLLARPELVPRYNDTVNRISKEVSACRKTSMECHHRESNP